MAVQQVPAGTAPPTADMVGNAFVHQYYLILHQSPENVHRFYQDVSKLGRPEENGAMGITSTMQAINEKILSLDYGDLRAEITTVDAQDSLNGGVLVLVTGYLTGRDDIRRKFTQSFFLAPQDKGYFVLNDIFRYVEEPKKRDAVGVSTNDVASPATPKQDPSPAEESKLLDEVTASIEDVSKGEKYNVSENGDCSDVEGEARVIEVDASLNDSDVTEPNAKYEDVPKKSYASIVKVMKEGAVNLPTLTPPLKSLPKVQEQQVTVSPPPGQVAENQVSSSKVAENGNGQEGEPDGHSIYLKGLPMNATYPQLENEFKRFGPIRTNGIQIRSQKGFCFGFVEFEELSAAQSAIEASPITIGGRQVVIEVKKSTARGNGRDRYPSGRAAAFRIEGARGRVNYGVNRGYNRGEPNTRVDFVNRNGSRGGYTNRGDGYHRNEHTGGNGGRMNRAGFAADAAKNTAPRVSAIA